MTLEEQYETMMDATERAPDQWSYDKLTQEAENVLLQMYAQILENKKEFRP